MAISRTAIVTGAARGIGLSIARQLGKRGHYVVLVDVLATPLEEAAEILRQEGIEVKAVQADLANDADIAALPTRIGPKFSEAGVLVNNAAVSPKHSGRSLPASEIPLEEWEFVLKVNLTAAFRLIQVCLPPMRYRAWGRIINISSRAGRSPGGVAGAHYVASKAGVLGMTRSFAKEVAKDGITVNAIAPGRIQTPMTEASPPEVLERVLQTIPVGRFGTPEEIAALVTFLAGEDAGFITGATFDINGGVLMI